MSAPATIDDLLSLIHKSGLFDPERLEACTNWAATEGLAAAPAELAQALVRAGLLTKFHAEQFMLGKYRGFTIGKYKVMERLGVGGMGIVYLCEHQTMRQKVAIKVLPTSKNNNPSALGRFYREARAAGALEHPNLVRAHDVGREGNLHFLVLDYVDGASMHQMVARSGRMDAARAAHYIGQAALGLEHARLSGLVHRDVKPANILVERNGTVRLLDLGLARFFEDETDPLTLKYDEMNVLGTADYVSPEQALNSHDVDTRADIYSLGCTFYFLLSGQAPFPGGKTAQKLIWHQLREPEPIRKLRPDLPPELAAIVKRMMAKEPADRFQTPGELAAALEPWLRVPAPLPTEAELPKLSPAASRNATLPEMNLGPVTPGRGLLVPGSNPRPKATAISQAPHPAPTAVKRPPRPRQVSQPPSATPHMLSSPLAADTDKTTPPGRPPRPGAPPKPQADPSPAIARAAPAPRPGLVMQSLRLIALLVLGVLAAVGARWMVSAQQPSWLGKQTSSPALSPQANPTTK